MAELTISTLIKVIIGVFVFVIVVLGVYLFFKERVIDFFRGLSSKEQVGAVFYLIS